jgi:addiction module HigA family antidote
MATRRIPLTHPGNILREEFIEGLGLTPYKVAKALGVPLPRVNDIVREKRAISAEMALMLARYFGTTDTFFSNLQADYDRRIALAQIEKKLRKIKPYAGNETIAA